MVMVGQTAQRPSETRKTRVSDGLFYCPSKCLKYYM
nr:MAG TPA: hypothetical protein [Caudoviricetes sp.]